MIDIIIATANRHKVHELTQLLRLRGIRWRSLAGRHAARQAREHGRTFDANAIWKAQRVARSTGRLTLADDSGIEVEALGWAPGVHSARYAGRHGDDAANNAKLLQELTGVPEAKRGARYRCTLALAAPDRLVALTRGTWEGGIARAPRGKRGFGYDPIFLVPRIGKTAAELPTAMKQRLSHRVAAARKMRRVLRTLVAPRGRRRAARR